MSNKILSILCIYAPFAGFSLTANAAGSLPIEFTGIEHKAIEVIPDASTGLSGVYVLNSTANASFQVASSQNVTISTFSNLGAAYAEEIIPEKNGDSYRVAHIESNRGYVITVGSSNHYIWIVDYSEFKPEIHSVEVSPESDCSTVILDINGQAAAIPYYSINGRKLELDRDIDVSYNTLEYAAESGMFVEKHESKSFSHAGEHLYLDAPLCNTEFTVSCDRFLKEWGLPEVTSTSSYYNAVAVDAYTSAEQLTEAADNEQGGDTDGLGGSAPCEVTFRAAVSDAAIFREWQLSHDSEFNDIFYRDSNLDFTYTFQDEGTTYVRFTASNDAATCDYYGAPYEVSIGSSALVCPNAFSPGSSEGINDIWKVSFKSIVNFECHIFNRWGICVAHFTNPSDGWDGKYKGKLAPAGVYYYVIKAKGADGKKYNLKGDINIINHKKRQGMVSSGNE